MKHLHTAAIRWTRTGPDFANGKYSREHTWTFDGGAIVPASPSPANVPAPWSNASHVDPEEAFVASIASCHMLTFLWLASRQGFQVDRYEDEAAGEATKNERGAQWISKVTLRPSIAWNGEKAPTPEQIQQLHHCAHQECYIANSIKTEVLIEAPH
ncbi:MAG TPA: OsmC family protein [Candidatus Acidoferrum sp.]|nr:OsmC family protein [Candidatus Acidoferrum sp.]